MSVRALQAWHSPPSPIEAVLQRLEGVKSGSHGYWACCPAHDDKNPSLSIDEAPDGTALIHCHAGCSNKKVVSALGLRQSDLFVSAAMYPYTDEDGSLLFQVLRYRDKKFRVRSPNEDGTWRCNVDGVRRVLYRLPEILSAIKDQEIIYITEGEKDADNLVALGFVATTNAFGAGKWRPEYSESLRYARGVILPDHDDAGSQHAQSVADSLAGIAAEVRILELPGLTLGGDVSDWLTAGGTVRTLEQLVRTQPLCSSGASQVTATTANTTAPAQGLEWPALNSAALYGLAGDFVRLIAPESEADPAALLIHFLVAFSNVIGRYAYFQVEATAHHLNLNAALVGRTSKGRKGTAEAHIRKLMDRVDSKWSSDHVVSGLSSGEGLISHVRDPQFKEEPIRRGGAAGVHPFSWTVDGLRFKPPLT